MSDIYFFTDVDLLNDQTAEQAFGVKSETKFHLTSSFTINDKNKNACAYAIMSGSALFLEQVNNDKVNVILKPLISPRIKMPVKYIVYRGLKKTDDIVCAKVNETDIVDKYFYPCNYNTENGMLAVDAGCVLGTFEKNSECGLEIILENSDLEFSIEKALLPNWSLEVPNEDTLQNRWKREQIRHFVDPAAFYGMHGDIPGGISFYMSNNLSYTNNATEVYENVLVKFKTKNTIYLDIRNEDGYSYDYYKLGYKLICVTDTASFENSEVYKNYSENGWPVFTSNCIDDWDNTDKTILLKLITSNEPTQILLCRYLFSNLETNCNFIKKQRGKILLINDDIIQLTINVPYYSKNLDSYNLSTVIRIDYIQEPICGIDGLFPVKIKIPFLCNTQKLRWSNTDVERLCEKDSEMNLMQLGLAEDIVNKKNICTYYAYPKEFLTSSKPRLFNNKLPYSGVSSSESDFLAYFNKVVYQDIINTQYDDITIFHNREGNDCYILGITEKERNDLTSSFEEKQFVFFSIQKDSNGINAYQYLLSAKSKLINGQEIESLNKITVYSTDECVFVSKEYGSVLACHTPPSDIVLHFRRDNERIHYGFDWLRDEYIGENGLCEGIPEQKINKNGIEQIIPPKSREEQQQKLKDVFEMCIINNQPYYIPWLNMYKNHAQVVTGNINSTKGRVQLKIEFSNLQIKDRKVLRFVVPEGIQVDLNVTDYPVKKKDEHGNYVDDRLQARVCDLKNRFITVFCTETSSNVRSIDVKDEQDKLVGKLNICSNNYKYYLSKIHLIPISFRGKIESTKTQVIYNFNNKTIYENRQKKLMNLESWESLLSTKLSNIRFYFHQAGINILKENFQIEPPIVINFGNLKIPVTPNFAQELHGVERIKRAMNSIPIYNDEVEIVVGNGNLDGYQELILGLKEFVNPTSMGELYVYLLPINITNCYPSLYNYEGFGTENQIVLCCYKPQSNREKINPAQLLVHEISHSLGLLEAFYVEGECLREYTFAFTKHKTDNIMDYLDTKHPVTKIGFWKWQIDTMHKSNYLTKNEDL